MPKHLLTPKLLKAAVFGANDGIITTFAVVAGVAGSGLATHVVLVLGISNLIADGISMAAGDYLGERSEQKLRRREHDSYQRQGLWKTGLLTFVAFVVAGALPLLPYVLQAMSGNLEGNNFGWSIFATAAALFSVGAARTLVTQGTWWRNGMEMLLVGTAAASAAYVLGVAVERWVLP